MNRKDVEDAVTQELVLVDPLQRALNEIGRRSHFTKADVRAALPPEEHMRFTKEFPHLLRRGSLAVDQAGIRVTPYGWDWILGGEWRPK